MFLPALYLWSSVGFMAGIDTLKKKLDAYIRKYYALKLVRGLVFWTGFSLITYLLWSGVEYFGRFPSGTRAILFWSYSALFTLWLTINLVILASFNWLVLIVLSLAIDMFSMLIFYLPAFLSAAVCPLKFLVGENSPNLCPTICSVTLTGTNFCPL